MSKEKKDLIESRVELHDGCEPVPCPNVKCNYIFLDLHKVFFINGDEKAPCRKCKKTARYINSFLVGKDTGILNHWYKCDECQVFTRRRIPIMKKFCPNCKEEYKMFWSILGGLPGHSTLVSQEKKILQVA